MQGNFIYGVASRGVLGNTYSINRKQKVHGKLTILHKTIDLKGFSMYLMI